MNNENNINGIPNVNDIKIEETPAESFANLYGNGTQQPAQPVQPQQVPNPQVVQPAQPVQPQQVPNPQIAQPVPPVQPQQVPNPQVAQPVPPVQPQPMPAQPVQPTPQMAPQPVQPVQVDADRMQSIEEQLSKTSQYKPEDFQQEKIDIPTTNEYEKNKSGLSFVIAISAILVLFLIALPFISKFFS